MYTILSTAIIIIGLMAEACLIYVVATTCIEDDLDESFDDEVLLKELAKIEAKNRR